MSGAISPAPISSDVFLDLLHCCRVGLGIPGDSFHLPLGLTSFFFLDPVISLVHAFLFLHLLSHFSSTYLLEVFR